MWRRRDHERYIGPYDPEHEMPDPDRDPGDRWQSDAYRRGARDSRYAYRWNPDRMEDRFEGRRDIDREYEMRWREDARGRDTDRSGWDRDFGSDRMQWGSGRDYGYGSRDDYRDRDWSGGDRSRGYGSRGGYEDRGYDRGMSGPHYDRNRFGSDRGWDYGRSDMLRGERSPYERDFGRGGRDDDRDWRRR